MTEQELIEIKNYLISNSQQVSDIPEVQDTSGVSSLPAIKVQNGQDDQVVRVPLTLLSPVLRMDGQILQYKNPDGIWTNVFDFSSIQTGGGSGTFTGTYKNNNKIIQKIGALQKGFDASSGIDYTQLFNEIFFPNNDNQFPQKPIYFGFMEQYPIVDTISQLQIPQNYSEFDYNNLINEGYFVIALPATFYLKRIEDSNGMNILGCFDLIYKSIYNSSTGDVYNVYVSPKLYYNDNLELTFTTKTGMPVQVVLNHGQISMDDVIPVVNITVQEAVKAVINGIKISKRDVQVALNSISISEIDIQPIVNSLSITIRDVQPILKSINIGQGVKSILKGIEVEQGYHSVINSISITEATKSNINSISIKEGGSILKLIQIKEAVKAVINSITIKEHE